MSYVLKQLSVLLQAAKRLRGATPQVPMDVLGAGPDSPADLLAEAICGDVADLDAGKPMWAHGWANEQVDRCACPSQDTSPCYQRSNRPCRAFQEASVACITWRQPGSNHAAAYYVFGRSDGGKAEQTGSGCHLCSSQDRESGLRVSRP